MTTPYHVNMDPDQALHMVKAGASLLFQNVPASTSFGINLQMFVVGTNFKGIKMMPPGPHFIYYSAASRYGGDTSPITGFFVYVVSSQVIVRQWDLKQEHLAMLSDASEEERYAQGVRNMEFDQYLAPYDLPHHATWQHLSNYITPDVIDRLQPVGSDISVMAEAALVYKAPQTAAEKKMYEHMAKLKPRFDIEVAIGDKEENKLSTSGRCFYTQLPGLIKRVGMSPSELTALNMDKATKLGITVGCGKLSKQICSFTFRAILWICAQSQELESVLANLYGGDEGLLLGELQFAFIAFLMGQSLEAFGQWKALMNFLFSCENAPLQSRTFLFTKFLEVLYWQLKQGLQGGLTKSEGPSLDDSWFSEDIFLKHHFKNFFAVIRDAHPIDGDLLRQATRLKKLVESVLGWTVDGITETDLDNEYAPVVVPEEEV